MSNANGADWMLGGIGKKAKDKKLQRSPTPLELDQVERYLEEATGDGKKLVSGLKAATSSLEALRQCGLTGEALVVLITEKCRPDKNGNATSAATVQRVLEGLFRLGEYVR